MGRKGIAMLIASVILTVSFSGDRVRINAGNSTWNSENSTVLNNTDSNRQSELGKYYKTEAPDLYAVREDNPNLGIKTTVISRGGDYSILQRNINTSSAQADNNSAETVHKTSQDENSTPKTVTITTKKQIKKSGSGSGSGVQKTLYQQIADYGYTFSKQYRGQRGLKPIPYVYGADGPNSFDCSGFVGYVYSHFGIYIGRSTYDIIGEGRAVSRKDLRPGDLIFPGPGHVQLYIGNGLVVHAPQTGDVVRVAPLPDSIYAIRRIVK